MKNDLLFLRDEAVALKGMELDITLDDSPLCRAYETISTVLLAGTDSVLLNSFLPGADSSVPNCC